MLELEKKLHGEYSSKRVKGEWFSLSPDDVAKVKSIKEWNHD